MDLPQTLRELRSEKRWYDEAIASLEELKRSKPVRDLAFLYLHRAQNGNRHGDPNSRRHRGTIVARSRRVAR